MVNEQIKIALRDTEHGSLMTFRRDFASIYCEQYKKAQQAATVTPIDIVLDIDTTDYSDDDLAQVIQNELFYAWQEIQNQIGTYQSARNEDDTIQFASEYGIMDNNLPVVTIPFLIEVIVNHFLRQKGIEDYEKVQWTNLIVTLLNTSKDNENEVLEKFIGTYSNITYKIYDYNSDKNAYDYKSRARLEALYHKLAIHIRELERNGKVQFIKEQSVVLDSNIPYVDYLTIAIDDLYLRNPKLSRYSKTYWEGIIVELNDGKRSVVEIFGDTQFSELYRYINNNTDELTNKYNKKLRELYYSFSDKYEYSYEQYNNDISSEDLILAISERYLSNDGLYNYELAKWLEIIENLLAGFSDSASVLSNPEHIDLKLFIYEDYLLRGNTIYSNKRIDIEDYRDAISIELRIMLRDIQLNPNLGLTEREFNSLAYFLAYASIKLEKGSSVIETLEQYPGLFLVLDGLTNISQFENASLYPEISSVYDKFLNSHWFNHLENRVLFKLKNTLDEVIIDGNRPPVIDLLELKKVEKGWNYASTHWVVTANDVFEFLTRFKGKILSLREVVKLDSKTHKILIHSSELTTISPYKYHFNGTNTTIEVQTNLNPNSFEFTYSSNRFKYTYTLKIKDIKGDEAYSFNTSNYQAFEELCRALNFSPDINIVNELIDEFKGAFIKANGDKDAIDKLYASLPTAFFNRKDNLNAIDDKSLKQHLENILSGTVDESLGSNEEMAVVNIIKSMSKRYAYTLLNENNALLYKIFRKLHQFEVSTGDPYDHFVNYMASLSLAFGNQKAHPIVWFSNEDWLTNDIEIEMTDWDENTPKIKIKNYFQKYIPWGNLFGTNEFLSDSESLYSPLELVHMQTMINGKPVSAVKVPVFMLYHKAKSKANWDTFTFVMDLISVLSVYGAGRVLISKGVSLGGKMLAGAIITKEISSKAIQQQGLTAWLGQEHPEILKWWTTIDFAGDIALFFTSASKANDVINRSKKLMKDLELAGVEVPNKYRQWLQRAREEANRLFNPEYARQTAVFMDGGNTLALNKSLFALNFNGSIENATQTFTNLLRGKETRALKKAFKEDLSRLMTNAKGKYLEDLVKLARGFDGAPQNLYRHIVELERIKLTQGKSILTSEHIRLLNKIDELNNIDDKILRKLVHFGFNSPDEISDLLKLFEDFDRIGNSRIKPFLIELSIPNKNFEILSTFSTEELTKLGNGLLPKATFGNAKGKFINTPKYFEQLEPKHLKKFKELIDKHPYKSFDIDFLNGIRQKVERFEQARLVNIKKGYVDVAQIAEDGKKYYEHVNKQLKDFILNENQVNFDNFINQYRINGKPTNDFMPKYKNFCEDMIKHRNSGKKITDKALREIMKDMRRHHIIMANVLQKNEVFQKIIQWGKNQNPPLGIGFHDFRKNIIILHDKQHGFHNKATNLMQKEILRLNDIFNNTEKKINSLEELIKSGTDKNFKRAYKRLKEILLDEKESIIKKVIQNDNGHLDKKHLPNN